jgi:hypothetical protein
MVERGRRNEEKEDRGREDLPHHLMEFLKYASACVNVTWGSDRSTTCPSSC